MLAKFSAVTRSDESISPASKERVMASSFGFVNGLMLLYFALAAPQVIARWTEIAQLPILTVLVVAVSLYIIVVSHWVKRTTISPAAILIWNALFVLTLTMTIALHQMYFPAGRDAYPIFGAAAVSWHWIPLIVALILSPVVFIDLGLFTRQIIDAQPVPRTLGIGFSIAAFWALIVIFANVSTTVRLPARLRSALARSHDWSYWRVGHDVPLFAGAKVIHPSDRSAGESLPSRFRRGALDWRRDTDRCLGDRSRASRTLSLGGHSQGDDLQHPAGL
jgi:hypothetical protein